jgi:hypothetical protein
VALHTRARGRAGCGGWSHSLGARGLHSPAPSITLLNCAEPFRPVDSNGGCRGCCGGSDRAG